MERSIKFLLIFLVFSMSLNAQLNNYKYIIVPTKFDNFKKPNQFRTSTLIKYLFSNEGFNTVYSDTMPDDLADAQCSGVKVKLIDDSGLLATKTKLALIDCNGAQIMISHEGKSKIKDLEQAYREAISESFGSFRGLDYKYEEKEEMKNTEAITVSFKNDVKSLKEEPKPAAKHKEVLVHSKPNISSANREQNGVLYAQPIEGGYQLVDATPKVVHILKNTSMPDVFLVSKNGKSGIVYKDGGKWFIEMDDNTAKAKELKIKF
jgi:hypothetical protein